MAAILLANSRTNDRSIARQWPAVRWILEWAPVSRHPAGAPITVMKSALPRFLAGFTRAALSGRKERKAPSGVRRPAPP